MKTAEEMPKEIFVAPMHGASSCGYGAWFRENMTNGDKAIPNLNLTSYTRTDAIQSQQKELEAMVGVLNMWMAWYECSGATGAPKPSTEQLLTTYHTNHPKGK